MLEVSAENTYCGCALYNGSPWTGHACPRVSVQLLPQLFVGPPRCGSVGHCPGEATPGLPSAAAPSLRSLTVTSLFDPGLSPSFQSEYFVGDSASLLHYLIPNSGPFPCPVGIECESEQRYSLPASVVSSLSFALS